jgi:hypothetical protein
MHEQVELSGKVWGVFAHRFAIEIGDRKELVDIGPKGLERVKIAEGDSITVSGERKPSEIKAQSLTDSRGTTHRIDWPPKHDKHKPHGNHHHHPDADPQIGLKAARGAGYAPFGEPRRKPKHWEIDARRDGETFELHVELDGHIRKAKPRD